MKLLVKIFYIFPLIFRIRNTSSSLPLRFLSDSSPICRTRKLSFPLQRTVGKVPSGWRWPFQQTNRRRFAPAQTSIIMAIVKGTFATNFSKRLGKVSFANRQGQNIARQRPASVKNPMTEGQQRQRMIFTTVLAAYKKLKPICDHSFEGVSYGAMSMARFMQANLNLMKSANGFPANFRKNTTCVAPFYWKLSEGSLTSPNLAQGNIEGQNFAIARKLPATGLADYTVQQLIDYFGIQLGQQLTFVSILAGSGTVNVDDIYQQNACSLQIARVIFKLDATLSAKAFHTVSGTLMLDPANLTAESKNISSLAWAEKTVGSTIYTCWQFLADYNKVTPFGWAVILSEKKGQSWARSTEMMTNVAMPTDETWDSEKVINTYNPKSSYYLNNATV